MLLGCLFLASCNETDCSYLGEFKLVESTTNYSAKACSGYILYDGGQGDAVVTATSSEAWCKVSADASKVYISLDDNYSVDSRTAMVTLTCGNQTKRVPVTQLGRVTEFSEDTIFYSCDNSAVGVDYKARNPFSFEVSGLPDWISYTASEDGVHFNIAANETGEYRKASAVVKAINTDMVQTVNFVQYSLFGDWIAVYEDIVSRKEEYGIDTPDINIDFRRVKNLKIYLDKYAISLTTDLSDISQWQGGDIVIFNKHIGVISDKRNEKGIPFLIHHAHLYQREYEENVLELMEQDIIGHYRLT